MAALGVRCNQMLGLKANVYQIILAIHLEAIGNVKQPPNLAFLVLLDGSLLKVIGMVYSHSWCVKKTEPIFLRKFGFH